VSLSSQRNSWSYFYWSRVQVSHSLMTSAPISALYQSSKPLLQSLFRVRRFPVFLLSWMGPRTFYGFLLNDFSTPPIFFGFLPRAALAGRQGEDEKPTGLPWQEART